jgi:WhiB family redox-sensing transcriptional regulator
MTFPGLPNLDADPGAGPAGGERPGGPIMRHALSDREDTTWQDFANCLGVDPDLFFPERGASTREAKEVCRGCIVRSDCLEYALRNGEKFGIWGGMSERERRRIRRQRAVARASGVLEPPASA